LSIPLEARNAAQAQAQFLALKGSHLNIAVSSLTSNAYYWFAAAAKHYGITIGTSATNGDVYFTSTGSVANEVTAYGSGKVDGLISVPPYTVNQTPASIEIEIGKLAMLQPIVANYLATTISMIQNHPDTVQAMTDAITYSTEYPQTHPRAAQSAFDTIESENGFASPEELEYLWAINQPFWRNPYPTQAEFSDTIQVDNVSLPTPFTAPYSNFVVTRFAKAANALNGLGIPNGVPLAAQVKS
jgi:ABC-type nitrate/sulfonate/bicarbonate transport system substrate-binding protein